MHKPQWCPYLDKYLCHILNLLSCKESLLATYRWGLEHERDVYLGKDTIVVYAREEDKSCDYLEINEIAQLPGLKKNHLTTGRTIQESDLVFSPAQVTEHRCVELKDQEISKQTRQKFEKLKGKYPKVFSTSSEDIGWTNLVTMHVDIGNNPPICQKPYTLPLKHYSWVQQEIETLEHAGVIKKSISLLSCKESLLATYHQVCCTAWVLSVN